MTVSGSAVSGGCWGHQQSQRSNPPRGVLQLQNPYDILLCKRNLADTHDPGTVRDIDRMQGRLFLCELTDGNACPQHNQHLKGRRLK